MYSLVYVVCKTTKPIPKKFILYRELHFLYSHAYCGKVYSSCQKLLFMFLFIALNFILADSTDIKPSM